MEAGSTLPRLVDQVQTYASEFLHGEIDGDETAASRAFAHLSRLLSAASQPSREHTLETLFEYLATGLALHEAAAARTAQGDHPRAKQLHELAQICLHHASEDLEMVNMHVLHELHQDDWMH